MVEMIEIVAPDGSPTGVAKPRDQIHRAGDWHRTVHVWVMTQARELLLQKRSAIKESHPGLWDVSCAGHIRAGDTSRQAAKRELFEELGLAVEADDLRYLFTSPSFFILNDGTFIDRELIDVYLHVTDLHIQGLRLQSEEVEAVTLIPIKTLRARIEQVDTDIVPHTAIYRKLFDYLDRALKRHT
jgi:isopentenyldiphosphate isomerase